MSPENIHDVGSYSTFPEGQTQAFLSEHGSLFMTIPRHDFSKNCVGLQRKGGMWNHGAGGGGGAVISLYLLSLADNFKMSIILVTC